MKNALLTIFILFFFLCFNSSLLAQEVPENNENTEKSTSNEITSKKKKDRKKGKKRKEDGEKEEVSKDEEEISDEELDSINPNLFRPRRAALLSAILPGAGQVYNGSIWKVPIVYAGFITFFSLARIEDERYEFWLTPFVADKDNNPDTLFNSELPSANNIQLLKENHRRDRDYYYILLFVWYGLNILDAAVDAHFRNFRIEESIDVSFQPTIIREPTGLVSGMQFIIAF